MLVIVFSSTSFRLHGSHLFTCGSSYVFHLFLCNCWPVDPPMFAIYSFVTLTCGSSHVWHLFLCNCVYGHLAIIPLGTWVDLPGARRLIPTKEPGLRRTLTNKGAWTKEEHHRLRYRISAAQLASVGIKFKSFSKLPGKIRLEKYSSMLYLRISLWLIPSWNYWVSPALLQILSCFNSCQIVNSVKNV